MRLVADASVDEIVLAFLRAEVDSRRYREFFAHLGLDRRLVEQPDLTDSAQNTARLEALAAHRGVSGTTYLGASPPDTSWQRSALTPVELGAVRYANYLTWIKLSGGTRRIREGAQTSTRCSVTRTGTSQRQIVKWLG